MDREKLLEIHVGPPFNQVVCVQQVAVRLRVAAVLNLIRLSFNCLVARRGFVDRRIEKALAHFVVEREILFKQNSLVFRFKGAFQLLFSNHLLQLQVELRLQSRSVLLAGTVLAVSSLRFHLL